MRNRAYTPSTVLPQRRTLTALILEKVAEFERAAIESIFPRRYPEARLWRTLLGVDKSYRFKKESFSTLLARLHAQGLITRSGRKRDSIWRLTGKGRKRLDDFHYGQDIKADGLGRIVIFDIPERERKKRDAVRIELVAAGFSQLQKSVWYGEQPLPQDFMELIDALQLKSCVHVFSIRNEGTLRDVRRGIHA